MLHILYVHANVCCIAIHFEHKTNAQPFDRCGKGTFGIYPEYYAKAVAVSIFSLPLDIAPLL